MRASVSLSIIVALALLVGALLQALPDEMRANAQAAIPKVLVTDESADIVVQADGQASYREVLSLAFSHGAKVKFKNENSGIITLKRAGLSEGLLTRLESMPGVISVGSEVRAHTLFTPNDIELSKQWGLTNVNAYQAWDVTRGNHSVVVGELDTGIDWNHPDIAPNIWTNTAGYHGYNFVSDNNYPLDDNVNGYDQNGDWVAGLNTYHGTHVAGVIGAVTNNNIGIAGIAQVRLMAVKVMNDSGEGTDAWVASGIRWAVDNGADIITMSLGVDAPSLVLSSAVIYASNHGVVMTAASGNDGASAISYPAAFPAVIAVGAVDETNTRAPFSDFGDGLDVMAPGVMVYSTSDGSGYQYLSGTSTAAPFVAGIVGLMLTVNPALTPVEIGNVLNSTATDLMTTVGWDASTGWGVVNAFRAVAQISGPTVTITNHPSYASPNSTFNVAWMVSGGSPGTISDTYLAWGNSSSSLTQRSHSFSGTTWALFNFSVSAPTNHSSMFFQAFATVDGGTYNSTLLTLPVHKPFSNNPISQFIERLGNFIVHDLGTANFLLLLVTLIAIPLIVVAARSRRHRPSANLHQPYMPPLHSYQPPATAPLPPPPPPPPRFEAYIDLVGHDVIPSSIKVVEGTKVVWVNRSWAPPPGIAVRSGTIDGSGEHHDGVFQSGLLIAPGDYWSATFHRAGTYDYYLTGIWKPGRVIVEPFKVGESQMSTAA